MKMLTLFLRRHYPDQVRGYNLSLREVGTPNLCCGCKGKKK